MAGSGPLTQPREGGRFGYWMVAYAVVIAGTAIVGGFVWGASEYPCWDSCIDIRAAGSPSGAGERIVSGFWGSFFAILVGTLSGMIPIAIVGTAAVVTLFSRVLASVGIRGPIAPVGVSVLLAAPLAAKAASEFVPRTVFVAMAISLIIGSLVAGAFER